MYTIENEIDAIHLDYYEKIKHMSSKELFAYIEKEVAQINDKDEFKSIVSIDEQIVIRKKK
ncbi:MAG: hypothetical protein LBR53_05550 [Deltaproteobacteria bacterium]|nr:hypothetical protein [Deltaproteobacteria bacterium]